IGALLEAGALTAGNELADAEALWAAVEQEAPRAHPPFDRSWFGALLAARGVPSASAAPRPTPSSVAPPDHAANGHADWGDTPDTFDFIGRTAELDTVRNWVLSDRCRVVGVLGLGGVGKSKFAAQLARAVAPQFELSYWRSLRNAPPVAEWLSGAIDFLS